MEYIHTYIVKEKVGRLVSSTVQVKSTLLSEFDFLFGLVVSGSCCAGECLCRSGSSSSSPLASATAYPCGLGRAEIIYDSIGDSANLTIDTVQHGLASPLLLLAAFRGRMRGGDAVKLEWGRFLKFFGRQRWRTSTSATRTKGR